MHSLKIPILLILTLSFVSCSNEEGVESEEKTTLEANLESKRIEKPEFQTFFDSTTIDGSILIYDYQKNIYYSNNFDWAEQGHLPASTFKIPNSIIALETGVAEDDSTLFKWNGEKRMLKSWEQDLIFKNAFFYSCVPCYRDIARRVGLERMNEYLDKLNYGDMKVDSSTLDLFWLMGDSKITQFEQVDFLNRLYFSELPISERTEGIMKKIMLREENDQYKLFAKTGMSGDDEKRNGWFVGYFEIQDQVYFFATNVEQKEEFDRSSFINSRNEVTTAAFKKLNLIK